MRITTITTAVAVAVLTGFAAGCTGTATQSVKPAPSARSPSPAPARSAHVGATFTVKGEDGSRYDVTLLAVAQNAVPGSEFDAPGSGKHLAGAEFRITAVSKVDENANNDASAVGSNRQQYTTSVASLSEGTNFNYGDIKLTPGNSLVGWVSFELPDGVKVTKVQWAHASGISGATAEWAVP